MADQKITQLTADATPTSDDLVPLVNDPAGTPGNKKATLADLATALAAMSGLTAAFEPQGTSFPGSPATGQRHFRTDRGISYYYDGTRWLSTDEYASTFPMVDAAIGSGMTAAAINAGRLGPPYRGTYDIYITRFQVQFNVLTTNTGTAYWTIKLNRATAADADTQVGSTISTQSLAASTNHDAFITPNVVLDSSARQLKVRCDPVLTPGGLFINAQLHYRLVG